MKNKEAVLSLLKELENAISKGDMLKAQIHLQQVKSLIQFTE